MSHLYKVFEYYKSIMLAFFRNRIQIISEEEVQKIEFCKPKVQDQCIQIYNQVKDQRESIN